MKIENGANQQNQIDKLNVEEQDQKVKSNNKEWISSLLKCLVLAFIINTMLIINAVIPSPSMETTIMTGDRVFGNRLSYVFDTPERGDVVVFTAPDEPKKLFVKRIIGTPGDKIEIVDGNLYLNDNLTDEPYINEEMFGSFGPYYVPEGNYFMMGDNRNHSNDSRAWINTYVPEDTIKGKALFAYYPNIHAIK